MVTETESRLKREAQLRRWQGRSIYTRFPDEDRKLILSLATRFYAMRRRCHGKSKDRKWYGDRGIECRFADVFDFLAYVLTLDGARDITLEVDREDNNGHYERGNLRFVTHQQNTQNKRHRWPELRRKQKEADDNELYW